jgi:hypothetical protein
LARPSAVGASGDGASSTELLVDPRKTMTKRYLGRVLAGRLVGCGGWAGQTGKFSFFLFISFLFFCFVVFVSNSNLLICFAGFELVT